MGQTIMMIAVTARGVMPEDGAVRWPLRNIQSVYPVSAADAGNSPTQSLRFAGPPLTVKPTAAPGRTEVAASLIAGPTVIEALVASRV